MLLSSESKEINIKDYIKIIRKRSWVIFSFFFVLVSMVTLFTLRVTPVYRATASLVIEKTSPKVVSIEEVYQPGGVEKDYYQTQYKILSSRTLVKKVVDELGLGRDPEFARIEGDAVDAVLNNLHIEPVRESRLVNVAFDSVDPIKAARIANAFARIFIQEDMETKRSASQYAVGWLDEQLGDMKKKLEKAEINLNKYVQEYKIVVVPTQQEESQGLLETLKKEQANVETDIQESSKRYKEKHPKMIALYSQLASVKDKIKIETDRLLDLNEKMIQYNVLKREVESNRQLYESLLKRAKETAVSEELQTSQIRIVDPAEVPRNPFKPKIAQNIILACILGLGMGLGAAFLLEYLDSTIKTAEDVELYVKLPFLGYVPAVKKEGQAADGIDLMTHQNTDMVISEAFRSIRTSIIFSSPEDRPIKTILITSTLPQEGKSSTVVNLATAFAQKNEQVVIVEADMRKQRLAKALGVDAKEGLSSFLAGPIGLERVIKKTLVPNLFIITAGPTPPNPAELLTSVKIKILLDELKKKFDRIIIDSPPVLAIADTAILANIADGVIQVIRSEFVNLDGILRSKQRLIESKSKILGVILNGVNIRKEDSYYYYHYYAQDKKEGKGSA